MPTVRANKAEVAEFTIRHSRRKAESEILPER